MKKVLKVFVLTLILTLCAASATVFAKSSYKTGLKKLSEAISGYEYSLLFSYQQMSYEEDNNLDVWVKEQEKRKPGIASLFCLSRLEYRANGNGLQEKML